MRADMGKVLVERPRVKSGVVPGRTGRRYAKWVRKGIEAGDGTPVCEGIKRRYCSGHGRMKHFNEHLGPLRKFVESNVGRPWDKVYGEICQHFDRGNVVQKHILSHLFQFVVVNVEMIHGEPYRKARSRSSYHNRPLRGPDQWYVCPKSGLLKRAKVLPRREQRKWKHSAEPARPVAWVSKSEFLRRGPGGWQVVTVQPWPDLPVWGGRDPRESAFDVLFRMSVASYDRDRLARYYGKRVYAVAVRPISEAALKELPVTLPGKLTAPNVVR